MQFMYCLLLLVLVWARAVALSMYAVCFVDPYRNPSLFISFVERDEFINP
jgi:hypothetical protein